MREIKFKVMKLQKNIEIVKWSYYEDDDVSRLYNYTIQCFPELAHIDKGLPREEVYKIIEEIVTKNYNKHKLFFEEEAKRYSDLWKKYNKLYFKMLVDFLGIERSKYLEIIECEIGIIPVFPRCLDEFKFSVSSGLEDWKVIEGCAHETLHFLWFEKWKEIHPETSREEFDFPYLVW